MKLNQTYTKKELKELSNKNPHIVYENGDGKVAHDGQVFKNHEEKERLYALMEDPPWILRIIKSILKFFIFTFIPKKK